MSTKLYVGGIPYSTTEAALGELFAKAGSVTSSSIIIDR
ncbi:RNA-binding protein, partial [Candidatus Parcubacteria bacterium]|nr:RNA-binding protein [Candidatus Parcubacteria bacterium]